jgi:hypothetical protein
MPFGTRGMFRNTSTATVIYAQHIKDDHPDDANDGSQLSNSPESSHAAADNNNAQLSSRIPGCVRTRERCTMGETTTWGKDDKDSEATTKVYIPWERWRITISDDER